MKDTNKKTHKSWGMIGFYRTCCGRERQLFGSDITNHNTIRLVIKHAKKHRELGRDWTMGDDTICEVELSALQYAELLTNMNVGDGVPCTIRYTNTDGHIEYGEERNKIEIIHEERNKTVEKASTSLQEVVDSLRDLINDRKLSKTVGGELLSKLTTALSDLEGDNFAFYKKTAREEIEKAVVEAKSQISEYVNHKIYSAGLETLINGKDIIPMINDGKENNSEP